MLTKRNRLDALSERLTRRLAQNVSRRSVLSALGKLLVGAAVLPVLPVSRKAQAVGAEMSEFAKSAQTKDPTQCNYWRYCATSRQCRPPSRRPWCSRWPD